MLWLNSQRPLIKKFCKTKQGKKPTSKEEEEKVCMNGISSEFFFFFFFLVLVFLVNRARACARASDQRAGKLQYTMVSVSRFYI